MKMKRGKHLISHLTVCLTNCVEKFSIELFSHLTVCLTNCVEKFSVDDLHLSETSSPQTQKK
uniref:Mitochondrial import inner membrane translocase subunit n=1 Tax=Cyprinus carpio TaxID=7962 RepID=A0A8C1M3D5_CYPCA